MPRVAGQPRRITAFGYTMVCEQSGARQLVEDVDCAEVAEQLACGPDVEEHVAKIRPYLEAGYDGVALVQIGGEHQRSFNEWAQRELLPALRSL